MKRRDFLAATGLAAGATLGASELSAQSSTRQYFELRHYHLPVGPKRRPLLDFLGGPGVPALNRLGIRPVGAFEVIYGPNAPSLYLLLPHPTLESVVTLADRFMADEEAQQKGKDIIARPLSDPAFIGMESSLMVAFDDMPRVEVPPQVAQKKSRIFELRVYQSHSRKAAKKKVEMFNAGGEIAIFRKTGLTPVFFGESLIGPALPNLTYMLVFDDMRTRDAAWDTFRKDPDWVKLRDDPQYADTVSNISDIILRPTSFSQI